MTNALALIPDEPHAIALADREQAITAWIEREDDRDVLIEARRRLAAMRAYYERSGAERDTVERLDLRAERRLGEIAPPPIVGNPSVTRGNTTPVAERVALSRARSLAHVPNDTFEEVLAQPKPSRAKVMAAATDRVFDSMQTPDTRRTAALYRLKSAVYAVSEAFERVDPPPTYDEADFAVLTALLRRVQPEAGKLEVVS